MTNGASRPHHPAYAWKGRNLQGLPMQGKLHAANAELARAVLRRQGLRQIKLQRLWWDRVAPVRAKDLAGTTRQLAALLRAGMPGNWSGALSLQHMDLSGNPS